MNKQRKLVYFREYYWTFFNRQTSKVKEKIDQVLYLITVAERIPKKFFEKITGYEGLFEIRIEYSSNIYRIFCCFDEGNIVVLFNGFQKKTQKTPKKELEKAARIKEEYFEYKRKGRKK
jgi:phage-related protein